MFICNRFHARQASRGKITFFKGYSFLTPLLEGNPFGALWLTVKLRLLNHLTYLLTY